MNVELPDGSTLTDVPDGTTQGQILQKLKAADHPAYRALSDELWNKQGSKVGQHITNALGEVGLQAGSSIFHQALAGYKGMADIATGKGVNTAVSDIQAEQAKTYQPQTPEGKVASKVAGYLGEKQGEAAEYLGGKTAQGLTALGAKPEIAGAAGAGVKTAIDAAPVGLLGKPIGAAAKATGLAPKGFDLKQIPGYTEKGPPKDIQAEMVQKARAAGYVLKPSEAGATAGRVAEGLAGSPKLSAEASIKNQKVTNKLVTDELGLPEGTRITRGALKVAKKPHNDVYKAVSELGTVTTDDAFKQAIDQIGRAPGKSFKKVTKPDIDKLREEYKEDVFDAGDAVLQVRQLRASSTKNIKAPNAPAQNELGYAQRQVADAIDVQLERHAQALGHDDLVSVFRQSRQELAKIHSVESALVGNTGDVSAQTLAKMQGKGVPLSGNLKLIADVGTEFGEVTQTGTKVKNKTPVTVLEGVGGVASAMYGHPAAIPIIAARPVTRKFLLSDYYQNKLGQGPKKAPTVSDIE